MTVFVWMSRLKKWRWGIFFFSVVVLILPLFAFSLRDIKRQYQGTDKATVSWSAAEFWMMSADCMKRKGAWLSILAESFSLSPNFTWAARDNSKNIQKDTLLPYECCVCADDVGHAFFLGLLSWTLNHDLRYIDAAYFNASINLLGLLALLWLLFATRCYMTFLLFLLFSKKIFFSYFDIAPHPATIGIAAGVVILPLSLLAYHYQILKGKNAIPFIVSGIFFLASASLIRGVIGHMGFIVSVGVLLFITWKRRKAKQLAALSLIGMFTFMAWQSPTGACLARNFFFDVQPINNNFNGISLLEGHHGLSHTLYVGLGAVPNKFGIEWGDAPGHEAVQKVSPGTIYCSPEYFKILKGLYLQHLKESPVEVMRIYFIKMSILLNGNKLILASLPLGAGLFLFLLSKERQKRLHNRGILISSVVISLAFVLLFIVQGTLAHPAPQYTKPVYIFVFTIFGIALDCFLQLRKNAFIKE